MAQTSRITLRSNAFTTGVGRPAIHRTLNSLSSVATYLAPIVSRAVDALPGYVTVKPPRRVSPIPAHAERGTAAGPRTSAEGCPRVSGNLQPRSASTPGVESRCGDRDDRTWCPEPCCRLLPVRIATNRGQEHLFHLRQVTVSRYRYRGGHGHHNRAPSPTRPRCHRRASIQRGERDRFGAHSTPARRSGFAVVQMAARR
jgi:hypothetical protein